MPEGGWATSGGHSLADLSARLVAADRVELKKNMTVGLKVATAPAARAVKSTLGAIMPSQGGLNQWLASSNVSASVRTGPKTAAVVLKGRKAGSGVSGGTHDLRAINQGIVRHPVFGNPSVWALTAVPAGWWEGTLVKFQPLVLAALYEAMRVTAVEAGFDA